VEPFRLSTETENEPSFFEVVFLNDGIPYRYGFEVNSNQIVSEWLFSVPKTKEAMLFVREEQIRRSPKFFKEGRGLRGRPARMPLLSVVAQFQRRNIKLYHQVVPEGRSRFWFR